MSAFLDINFNNFVKVKLTETGKRLLAEGKLDYGYEFTKDPDQQGYHKIQLWVLAAALGKYMYNGCHPPVETGALIEIKGKE